MPIKSYGPIKSPKESESKTGDLQRTSTALPAGAVKPGKGK